MTNLLARLRNERGATATEYVLLLVGVALILIVGAFVLGNALNTALSDVGSYVTVKAP